MLDGFDEMTRKIDVDEKSKNFDKIRQLIVDYLPELIEEKGEKETINASDLYNKCIQDELRRKSSELEFIIPGKYRLEILQKVAVWMFMNDAMNFDTGLLERELNLRQYFKTDRAWEFEKYLNEFLTFTFLIREADNRYRISHKSFRDYLTARAFVEEIDSGKIELFAGNRTTWEINHFILEQNPGKEALLDLVLTARDLPEERQWQGTNAAAILLKIDKNILKGRDLSRCRLSYVDFKGCDLTGTKFQNANLGNCSFNETVLSAIFQGTNVENSGLYLSLCDLNDIKFLKEFKGLTRLDLRFDQITDISPIRELKNLRNLYLSKNQMYENQKAGLKETIPGLVINEWELEL